MSDVIETALAEFKESGSGGMDSLGNMVVGMDSGAVDDAATEDVSAVEDTGSVVTDDVTDGSATVTDPTVDPAAPAQDDIDKLLAKEGIEPKSVRGENRIPYSRTKKIIANAQKEWQAQADTKFATEREQFTGRISNYERQEQLASQDPDRYISLLASLDPRYQKFLGSVGKDSAPASDKPAVNDDPEPQALLDENKNPYYTPELWQKWQAWSRREATREATKALEAKYGKTLQTVQQREDAKAAVEARRPFVAAQISRIIETYGEDLVAKHQTKIIEVMGKEELNAAEAAAKVLLPLIRQDEATIRTKVLAEINARPGAVRNTQPSQRKDVTPAAPLSGEALILAELDKRFPNRERS